MICIEINESKGIEIDGVRGVVHIYSDDGYMVVCPEKKERFGSVGMHLSTYNKQYKDCHFEEDTTERVWRY